MSKREVFAVQNRFGTSPSPTGGLLSYLEMMLEPAVLLGTLWMLTWYGRGEISAAYLILSLVVFALTFPGISRIHLSFARLVVKVLLSWFWTAGMILLGAHATKSLHHFSAEILTAWFWIAPLSLVASHALLRRLATSIVELEGPPQNVVIVGMNAQGIALANSISTSRFSNTRLCGFFDDQPWMEQAEGVQRHLGPISELATYVKRNRIAVIYLSLPMTAEPRVLQILDELKDTTASIYFVPNMFVTDLIQGRTTTVNGVPVIAVCETPFHGLMGIVKRVSDVVLAAIILLLMMPVLISIALAIKLTSPGPVIFRQRRYGLDGKEIVVYKFRSMTVMEDGGEVRQAARKDPRVTRLGAFLRKTSLDELPQFLNVLQGRMSVVGPRPHAIVHNELYRNLVKGYMVRHKVKPGITGWAQVNGCRGETDTLGKMRARIDYDLDYLRNWSLRFDLLIIYKTVRLIFADSRAY